MATSLTEWFECELRKRGLRLTEEDLQRIVRVLEERGWISIHPELYRGLMEEIEKLIDRRPELGYASIADFIADAVRRRLEELSKSPLER
ncbi:hypothetical protein KEJ27_09755 [Candidatus Bathyarchaeota archaeon]|nr:hypothetical protein [Candidatus Bathyarchaeota archaeon]